MFRDMHTTVVLERICTRYSFILSGAVIRISPERMIPISASFPLSEILVTVFHPTAPYNYFIFKPLRINVLTSASPFIFIVLLCYLCV
jgi:hypothetical protein